jgi:hypothetical protein
MGADLQRLRLPPSLAGAMDSAMLYLPSPSDAVSSRTQPWHARLVARLSHPIMWLILALSCLALWSWPRKRPQLRLMRARVPVSCSVLTCLWILANAVLQRWPYFVVMILSAGAAIGLLLSGFSGLWWGLGSSIVGAGLAPVLADELPPRWFQRSSRR